jgi:hypothetical protein
MSRSTFGELRLRTESAEAAQFYETLGFRPIAEPAEYTHTLQVDLPV